MSVLNILELAKNEQVFLYVEGGALKFKSKTKPSEKLTKLIVSNKAKLIDILSRVKDAESDIKAADYSKPLKLSYSQERLWFIDKMSNSSTEYNMLGAFKLLGELDLKSFGYAIKLIIERHEALRSSFYEEGGRPYQRIQESFVLPLEVFDLSKIDRASQEESIIKVSKEEAQHSFDLSKEILVRVKLIKTSPKENIVFFNMHHIASDGWSMGIFIKEFTELYRSSVMKESSQLKPLKIQYVDYSSWQREQMSGERLEREKKYWKKELEGISAVHNLPLDYLRPAERTFNGDFYTQTLEIDLSLEINELCKKHNVTLFMFLQTAFALLLSKFSNSPDIVMGTPVAGRNHHDTESLIGMFVNTLVLRTQLDEESTFRDYLLKNRNKIQQAFEHQQLPFEMVVESVKPDRNMGFNPIFQIMFMMQNNGSAEFDLPGLSLEPFNFSSNKVKFELELVASEVENQLLLNWSFNTAIFKKSTIENLSRCFYVMLESIVKEPEVRIKEVELQSEEQKKEILFDWNNTALSFPVDKCIHQIFEEQAREEPNKIAVIFDGKELTYRELNEQSNQLAHYLLEHHDIKPDSLVGLCVERSTDMVVGMLGILKAGGAYVPLDPKYPESRLSFILDDAGITAVLSQLGIQDRIPSNNRAIICLDDNEFSRALEHYSIENIKTTSLNLNSNNLAYVIFTSGSTGQPKGVMIEHRSVVSLVIDATFVELSSNTIMLQNAPMFFDVATLEIWGPLLNAGKMIIQGKAQIDMKSLNEFINVHKVNTAWMTSGLFDSFVLTSDIRTPELKYLLVGGDVVNKSSVNRMRLLNKDIQIINGYGPTENTTFSSTHLIPSDIGSIKSISIGKPFQNRAVYVLDSELNVLPIGVVGELCVAGEGVARGYLNRDDLNAEKFVSNPYSGLTKDNNFDRLYKTGDLVRYLPDGNLEFIGRIDDQVKIRGFRIELGEVENQLSKLEEVDSCVVLTKNVAGSKQLVGYIMPAKVIDDENQVDLIKIMQAKLSEQLPDYMVPSMFLLVESWPLTSNGKTDKKALLALDIKLLQHEYIAPVTDTEYTLVKIWAELLGVVADKISTTANFFELGGHSLLLVRLLDRLQSLKWEPEIGPIYRCQSLRDMGAYLDTCHSADTFSVDTFKVPSNLIPTDCKELTPQLLPLIDLTKEEVDAIVAQVPSGVENIQDIYPLGPLQQGILYQHQLTPDSDPYVMEMYFEFSKEGMETFINAINKVVLRHDVLRTVFFWQNVREPVQVVLRKLPIKVIMLEDVDLRDEKQRNEHLPKIDITQGPVVQLAVARTNNDTDYTGVLLLHHLVNDHEGMEVLQQEVSLALAGDLDGLPPAVPYRNVIARLKNQDMSASKLYFSDNLSSIEEPTIPYDIRNTQQEKSHTLSSLIELDMDVSQKIREWCRQQKFSPAAFFHCVYALVLSKVCNQSKVVFGTVLSGRLQADRDFGHAIGLLINTLPFSIEIEELSVFDFINTSADRLIDLVEHEQFPLVEAQRRSGIEGSGPLFTALFNYRHSGLNQSDQPMDEDNDALDGIKSLGAVEYTNYPFSVSLNDNGFDRPFSFSIEVDKKIDIDRIGAYLKTTSLNLLNTLLSKPETLCHGIQVLPKQEEQQLLFGLNDTTIEYPKERCIHELFEQQAIAEPNHIAVIFEDIEVTYRELNERSNQLAHYLREHHDIKPDTLVGLCLERSLEMVVGMLGILKIGGAYVPLDPSYPTARLNYLVSEADLSIVLGDRVGKSSLAGYSGMFVDIDGMVTQDAHRIRDFPVDTIKTLDIGLTSSHLAYLIYTSGSTGQPKGVMVEHRGVVNTVSDNIKAFELCSSSVFFQSTSIGFDATTWVVWMALTAGSTLRLSSSLDIGIEVTKYQDITHLMMTPSMLELIDPSQKGHITHVIAGGEYCPSDLVERWLNYGAVFYNAYGPTEVSICSSIWKGANSQQVSIGHAISNTQLLVLSDHKTLSPKYSIGELYIGGDGLARGYLNRPELTSERFIDNPFYDKSQENSSSRLYKTGDMVRYLPDGNLEFIGRIDDQVKIRGFRIELGEVESQLSALPEVDSCVVLVKRVDTTKQLAGYIKSTAPVDADNQVGLIQVIKEKLMETLPDYMVPNLLMLVENWPLTPNGKVNKDMLLSLDTNLLQQDYVAPTNKLERQLCEVFQEVLEISKVGTQDNFYHIGGDSILAMQVVSRANKIGLRISVKQLLESQSVESLAKVIGKVNTYSDVEKSVEGEFKLLPIHHEVMHTDLEKLHHYNMSVLLEPPLDFDEEILKFVIKKLYLRHDSFRIRFAVNSSDLEANYVEYTESLCEQSIEINNSFESRPYNSKEFKIACQKYQESLNLKNGPLLKAVIFKGESKDRLLLIIHHSIVDGVSWRILMADIEYYYHCFLNDEKDSQGRTGSYKDWAEKLHNFSHSKELYKEKSYWLSQYSQDSQCLTKDKVVGLKPTIGTTQRISLELSEIETESLLKECNEKYQTNIKDLLLASVFIGLRDYLKANKIQIGLEGHGRENLFDDIDISETVGWFTTSSPLLLKSDDTSIGEIIKAIKQQLREVPNNGIGYGLLRYILKDKELVKLSSAHRPSFVFNYLGQFDQTFNDSSLFSFLNEDLGTTLNDNFVRPFLVGFQGAVMSKKLSFALDYSDVEMKEENVIKIADLIKAALLSIIQHCSKKS